MKKKKSYTRAAWQQLLEENNDSADWMPDEDYGMAVL